MMETEKPQSGEQSRQGSSWEHQDLAQIKVKVLRGHEDKITSANFFNDGRNIITASWDKSVKIWDLQTGDHLQTFSDIHQRYITAAQVNCEGNRFVSCGWDKKVCVRDIETGAIIWNGVHGGVITCATFSHDGRYVASCSDLDNSVKLWEAETGELIYHIPDLHTSTVTKIDFTPGDDRLITSSMDKSVKFWDIISHTNTLTLKDHTNVVSHFSMTPDERKFATCSWDKTIRVYDIMTGAYRKTGPAVLSKAHDGCVSSCDISTSGSVLASCGYDNSIVLWDSDDNVLKLKLQGHSDWIEDIKISPDEDWVMTASKDATVRLWDISDADNIPIVVENRKSGGLASAKCTQCGKLFSLATVEESRPQIEDLTCVFCRMKRGPQLPDIPDY